MDDLLLKYFEGKMDALEKMELLSKVKSDEALKKEFIRWKNYYSLSLLKKQDQDSDEGRQALSKFQKKTKNSETKKHALKWATHAAVVALFVGAVWYLAYNTGYHSIMRYATQMNEVYVPAGLRTKIFLSDGTVVWLNSKSSLRYPSAFSDQRNVELEGEAYFDVKPNPDQPFVVKTKGFTVRVLGTEFNVQAYPGEKDCQVVLFKGHVIVKDTIGNQLSLLPKQSAHITSKGVFLDSMKELEERSWVGGIIMFTDESFGNIISKLNLYYDARIEISDKVVSSYRFTGKFRQSDGVETILKVLQRSYPFKIEQQNNRYILSKLNR